MSLLFAVSCGLPAGDGSGKDGVGVGEHRVFITSSSHNGNLGGLAGADAICQTLARQAGLSKTYRAIMGDSTTAANERLNLLGAVYLFSGSQTKVEIVRLGVDLWSSFLLNPINRDERFNLTVSQAWTGTNSDGGNSLTQNCAGWTSGTNGSSGGVGDPSQINDLWLEDPPDVSCDAMNRIYCISQ